MPNVTISLKLGHLGRPDVIDKIKSAGITIVEDLGMLGMLLGTTEKTEEEIRTALKPVFAVKNIIYVEAYALKESEKTGEFVGLTEDEAVAAIKQKGWLHWVSGKDGHRCAFPKDWHDFTKPENQSRVHLIVENGKIIKSWHEHPFFKPPAQAKDGSTIGKAPGLNDMKPKD